MEQAQHEGTNGVQQAPTKGRFLSKLQPLLLGAGVIAGVFAACVEDPKSVYDGPSFGATIAADNLENPVDAVPSPDASVIYYIAEKGGVPTVFKVSAAGGTSTAIHSGAPFVDPRGIVTSSDGDTLYIADPGAKAVFALAVDGTSPPEVVSGTADTVPAAVDLKDDGGVDRLYIAGRDSKNTAALMMVDAAGGTLQSITAGTPMVEPDGVAVLSDGDVYIADRAAASGVAPARLFVWGGDPGVTNMGMKMVPGTPMGLAITANENVLLVSTLNADTGASEVVLLEMHNHENVWIQPIEGSTTSGGVHCSRLKNVCAWAGFNRVFKVVVGDGTSSSPGGIGG